MQVELWICPNGHYYGSSSTHGQDLEEKLNYQADLQHAVTHDPAHPMVVGNRGQCQQCKAVGKIVQRTRVTVEVPVPLSSQVYRRAVA